MDAGAGVGMLSDPPPRGRRASGGSYGGQVVSETWDRHEIVAAA